MPRADWEGIFRAQGMKNPLPRTRMLDGFNEGWIDVRDQGHLALKGHTPLVDVIAALVARLGWPARLFHTARLDKLLANRQYSVSSTMRKDFRV